MLENLRQSLLFYAHHLYTVDFLFIFLVFFVFISLLILALFLAQRPMMASFVIIWDFVICYYLVFEGYAFLDSKVRAREAEIMGARIAAETNYAIDFNITNLSKYNFTFCKITTKLYRQVDDNASMILRYQAELRPYRVKSKRLESLKKGETLEQRINFENFNKDANVSIKLATECY